MQSNQLSAALRVAEGWPASSNGYERTAILACDWNGTLVNDSERAWQATTDVLRRRCLPTLTLETFLAEFRLPLSSLFAALGVESDDLAAAEADWNRAMESQPVPELMPGVVPMLDAMDELGIGVGVVSAAADRVVLGDAESLRVAHRLTFLVGSATRKRDVLRELAGETTLPVAYLGDTEHDIDEANAAHVESIGFTGGYRSHQVLAAAGAGHIISSLTDVVPIMRRLLVSDNGCQR